MNPFAVAPIRMGKITLHPQAVDVDDRLRMVARFDVNQCTTALAIKDLQISVRRAIKSRLRKLAKASVQK